jgi:ABC-type Fe3+/spermidine/putrescine transport system ATPase subunit
MDRGRLQQIADPVSIYEKPANATVGSFIGQANVWTGTALAVNADRVRVKLAGGADILATGTGLTPGRACKVFIKHERIALTRAQPAHTDNWFVGRVTGRTYLGDSTSYAVALAGDLSLKGVVPNRSGFEHFDTGDEVIAAWAATGSQVFSA